MRIGELADRLGTTPHAIRFYERNGLLPGPCAERQRRPRLLGVRRSAVAPPHRAPSARLAAIPGCRACVLCTEGRCEEVSSDARAAIVGKRRELMRRIEDLTYLDRRLAHLSGQLTAGKKLRNAITIGKEEGA